MGDAYGRVEHGLSWPVPKNRLSGWISMCDDAATAVGDPGPARDGLNVEKHRSDRPELKLRIMRPADGNYENYYVPVNSLAWERNGGSAYEV